LNYVLQITTLLKFNVLEQVSSTVPNFGLTTRFEYFFRRLNPSTSFVERAVSQHSTITALIEDKRGLASALSPRCFLQGSYKQDTAIYTINDVDIVALCELWYPGSGSGKNWDRDEIFDTIAAPLLNDWRYKDKVRYSSKSTCIKIDLGIKVEILPVVYRAGNNDFYYEPFCLYRPDKGLWVEGYARYHQQHLSRKNRNSFGNFIPAIKVFKHLNAKFSLGVTSFYIESLLYSLPSSLYEGGPAHYIEKLLSYVSALPAEDWYTMLLNTPCGDRRLFSNSEWSFANWEQFHKVIKLGAQCAELANRSTIEDDAVKVWQLLLGAEFFPYYVSS